MFALSFVCTPWTEIRPLQSLPLDVLACVHGLGCTEARHVMPPHSRPSLTKPVIVKHRPFHGHPFPTIMDFIDMPRRSMRSSQVCDHPLGKPWPLGSCWEAVTPLLKGHEAAEVFNGGASLQVILGATSSKKGKIHQGLSQGGPSRSG
jgi:hypothetical protein